jgi:hypothetical protein
VSLLLPAHADSISLREGSCRSSAAGLQRDPEAVDQQTVFIHEENVLFLFPSPIRRFPAIHLLIVNMRIELRVHVSSLSLYHHDATRPDRKTISEPTSSVCQQICSFRFYCRGEACFVLACAPAPAVPLSLDVAKKPNSNRTLVTNHPSTFPERNEATPYSFK